MKILGIPNSVITPSGSLIGPGGEIPISGVQTTLAIGTIPTCRVSIPVEFLNAIPKEQNDDLYQVVVSNGAGQSATLFRGYVAGPRGRITDRDVSAGLSLVHPARDMDQMRISAPSFHPGSVFDYNYMFKVGSDTEAGSGFNLQDGRFYTGGNLPQSLINGIIRTLKDARTGRLSGGGTEFKSESLGPAIALLESVIAFNGSIRDDLVAPLVNEAGTGNSINAWAESRVMGSFNTMRSVWDTLAVLFAEFGVYLLCDCQGRVFALADCTGFRPPDANVLGPEYITSAEWVSLFTRNIKEVNLICDHLAGEDMEGGGVAGTLVTYPKNSKLGGASMALQMPGWLSPISTSAGYPAVLRAQEALAKTFFQIERNKLRTMSISGPLAPNVSPGTTAVIKPFSKMKMLSGVTSEDLNETYTGYCYQVDHILNVDAKVLQTNFSFRNVTRGAEDLIEEHPIFSDVKAFPWA